MSTESVSGSISINNPNYKYSDNAVYGSLDISASDKTETSGFESDKTGFTLGTQFEQYKDVYLSPSILISYETIDVEASASSAIKKMDGTYTNLDFMYGVTFDTRNQFFKPTEGYIAKFTQLLPIVMDSSYILNGLDVKRYNSFSDNVIGSLKVYARTIHGVDDDVKLTSRLFIPGRKLRGFKSGLGHRNDGGNTSWSTGGGGAGAAGGFGSTSSNDGGGGGSGYADTGVVTIKDARTGGSTGNAKVILRVVV